MTGICCGACFRWSPKTVVITSGINGVGKTEALTCHIH